MRRGNEVGVVSLVAVLAVFAASHGGGRLVHAETAPVTWRGQVAPVVFSNCTSCHHPGGSGPFDLTDYLSAKRWAPQIADVVGTRYMPPWLPEPIDGPRPVHFEGDRRLKPSEIELLTEWVKAGAPEGTGDVPRAPVYRSDWAMGPPDLVLEMPSPVTEPASGSDVFVNFILPATVTQTRWIRALEIKPGVGTLVHHANLIVDRSASLRAAHPGDWQRGIPGMDLEVDAGDAFDPDSHFLFWKQDSTALVEPAGMPWRLDPGNDLILNMHLKPTGKPEQVRARVGLYFAARPATEFPMLLQLEHDAALNIPAGDSHFVVKDELTLPVAVDVLGVYPHAHYLCREMKGWAALPNGQEQPLVQIKNWDLDRQSVYRLKEPLTLPAGTVLHMQYTYDNTADNVHNPHAPPVAVHGGNRATDEMSHLWLQVLPHGSGEGDARVPLQKAWMENTLRKSPNDAIALYNLGALSQMGGDLPQAEMYYRRLLAEHPRDPRVLTSLGSALEAAGDREGAQRNFKAALAADPSYTDAAYDLAQEELQAGQSATAESLFRQVVAKHPEDIAAGDGLAESLLDQKRDLEAIPLLNDLVRRKPEDPTVHRLLARAAADGGDAGAALQQLEVWSALAPKDPDPHRARAQVLSATGHAEEAVLEEKAALDLAPKSADDWNDLGSLEMRAGHRAEGRAAFEQALRLNPRHEAARANLERLEVGR